MSGHGCSSLEVGLHSSGTRTSLHLIKVTEDALYISVCGISEEDMGSCSPAYQWRVLEG